MAQITLHIDQAIQQQPPEAAALRKVSQSWFVADLVRQATASEWPPEVLALFGAIPDFPLAGEWRAGLPPDAERVSF